MKCKDCGGEMSFDEINSTGRHLVWATCFDVVQERERAALSRAETAEAEAQRLSVEAGELFAVIAQIGEALGIPISTPNLCQTVKARVAELEAQLAAQGWRPVTDDEPEEATEVELLAVGYRDGGNWYYHDDNPVRGWRPLPAPDTEPTP